MKMKPNSRRSFQNMKNRFPYMFFQKTSLLQKELYVIFHSAAVASMTLLCILQMRGCPLEVLEIPELGRITAAVVLTLFLIKKVLLRRPIGLIYRCGMRLMNAN